MKIYPVFVKQIFLLSSYLSAVQNVEVCNFTVNQTKAVTETDLSFLSVALSSRKLVKYLRRGKVPFTSDKFLALCEGLSKVNINRPEIYLRMGGADDVIFKESGLHLSSEKYVLNHTEWDMLNDFTKKFQWKLIFGLNSLLRRHDGSWDPTNAIELMRYTKSKGYLVNYELGNGNHNDWSID